MGFLDVIAPRTGPKQRRYGLVWILKASFFGAVLGFGIFVAISFVSFDDDREVETIPATSNSAEAISKVQEFLKERTHTGFSNQEELSGCSDLFGDKEFQAEYLNLGSWQVNAYYELVRYYWRVDDVSGEVTRDLWLVPKNVLKLDNPRVSC